MRKLTSTILIALIAFAFWLPVVVEPSQNWSLTHQSGHVDSSDFTEMAINEDCCLQHDLFNEHIMTGCSIDCHFFEQFFIKLAEFPPNLPIFSNRTSAYPGRLYALLKPPILT